MAEKCARHVCRRPHLRSQACREPAPMISFWSKSISSVCLLWFLCAAGCEGRKVVQNKYYCKIDSAPKFSSPSLPQSRAQHANKLQWCGVFLPQFFFFPPLYVFDLGTIYQLNIRSRSAILSIMYVYSTHVLRILCTCVYIYSSFYFSSTFCCEMTPQAFS